MQTVTSSSEEIKASSRGVASDQGAESEVDAVDTIQETAQDERSALITDSDHQKV